MIRSEQSRQSSKEGECETCWTREESPCVRLELADGSWPILPYAQMQSAWFYPESPTERLELRFPPYQVRIAGGNLRKLAVAERHRTLSYVRPYPFGLRTAAQNRLFAGQEKGWKNHSVIVESLV